MIARWFFPRAQTCHHTLYSRHVDALSLESMRNVSATQRLEFFARTVGFGAGTFGLFLAVGSAVRCETPPASSAMHPRYLEAMRDLPSYKD